jgi:hypothetical protein
LHTDIERRGRVRLQLRQSLQASQHRDGDQFAGLVVEHTGVEHVAEDEPAQDLHQLRIVVGRTVVARPEQPLIGGLGVGLALRRFGVVLVGSHSEPLSATRKDPSRVGHLEHSQTQGGHLYPGTRKIDRARHKSFAARMSIRALRT